MRVGGLISNSNPRQLFEGIVYMIFLLSIFACSFSEPFKTVIFSPGDEGSKQYRIPALVRTHKGTLIAATDKRYNGFDDLPGHIEVVVKRSTDNGRTWGETITVAAGNPFGYGDASLVVDRETGKIMCLFNGNNGFIPSTPSDPIRNYYSISEDDGLTWSAPVDITNFIYGTGCSNPERQNWHGLFITSGNALQLRSGRIMAAAIVRKHWLTIWFDAYVVYTDDFGKTWDVGLKPGCTDADESKLIELNNGDVMMSIRHKPQRYQALSHDKGLTFDDYTTRTDMNDPNCNGEIIRYTSTKDGYDKDRILFVNDDHQSIRMNLTVKISYDEAKSWKYAKVLAPGKTDYASMTTCDDGTIAIYYEDNRDDGYYLTFTSFSLEWLTDGNDSYSPPNKK